jgi:hypothetical protein
MSFIGVVEPEQLTILTAVVDQHCLQAGIDLASPERQVVAQLVMAAGFLRERARSRGGGTNDLRLRRGRSVRSCSQPTVRFGLSNG